MLRIQIAAGSAARRRAISHMVEIGTRHFGAIERMSVKPAALARQAQEEAALWLRGRDTPETSQEALEDDGAATVLVIDDAGTGPSGHPLSTSREAIGAIRATGRCLVIVAVDTAKHCFDAAHLFGDHHSPADLSVRLSDLAHPALWRRERGESGFPAYWPELAGWTMRRRMQMDQLLGAPKATLEDVLGWPRRRFGELSRRQAGCLDPAHTALAKVRWSGAWARSCGDLTLAVRERMAAASDHGRPIPQWHARHAMAALGAAWLDRWVRLELLPVSQPLLSTSRIAAIWPQVMDNDAGSVAEWIEKAQTATAATSDPCRDTEAGKDAFDKRAWNAREQPAISAAVENPHWYPTRVFDTAAVRAKAHHWPTWKLEANALFCEARSSFFEPDSERAYEVYPAQENAWPRTVRSGGAGFEPRTRLQPRS